MVRIGIDIGGTFTDLCVVGEDGRCWTTKLLTTTDDPSVGFMQILKAAHEAKTDYHEPNEIVHATTVATNAILEQKTARMGLITTRGFRDVLEIGRHFRRDLYNLFLEKPPALIPRDRRLEVSERIGPDGHVLISLDRKQVEEAVERLVAEQVEVIVIGFLHSYANPRHEQQAAEWALGVTDVPVITSHSVCSEYREFERFSTAAVHGAVMPKVRKYLQNIEQKLHQNKISAPLSVMQSNGGMCSSGVMIRQPGAMIESGPAAGVIAVAEVGRRLGLDDLISFDMGGTTAKATLILGGHVGINHDYEVGCGIQGGFGTGYPIRTPVVDLVEIGTGGGSLARVDEVGHLHVGPESAGAQPGPACYGLGGCLPTVTDANLVLGRLNADHFAGGNIMLDVAAARDTIDRQLGNALGLSVEQTAAGIIALANAQMARALRLVSIERGHDPRDFTMVAFGGAGPMHAAELALELGCSRVVIPPEAGVQSAWGLLVADTRRDFGMAIDLADGQIDLEALREHYQTMVERGRNELRLAGVADESIDDRLTVDVRYAGQAYELMVLLPDSPTFDDEMVARIDQLFHELHDRQYGRSDPNAALQWIALRATVVGKVTRPGRELIETPSLPLDQRRSGTQRMIWGSCEFNAPLYHRSNLGCGDRIEGPALIIQDDSSIAVPPKMELIVEQTADLVLLTKESSVEPH